MYSSEFYHPELKNEYLHQISNDDVKAKNIYLFKKTAKYIEGRLDKDLSQLSYEELQKCLKDIGYKNAATMRSELSMMKSYILWCQDRGIADRVESEKDDVKRECAVDGIKLSEFSFEQALKETLFKDELQLYEFADKLKPCCQGFGLVPLCVFLWYGIDKREIPAVRNEDVDLERELLHFRGEERRLSQTAASILRVYDNIQFMTEEKTSRIIYRVHKKDFGFFMKKMFPENSIKIARPFESKDVDYMFNDARCVYNRNDEFSQISAFVTPSSILTSGRLNRMYQMEVLKGQVEDAWIIGEFKIETDKDYYRKMKIQYVRQLYRDYKNSFWSD